MEGKQTRLGKQTREQKTRLGKLEVICEMKDFRDEKDFIPLMQLARKSIMHEPGWITTKRGRIGIKKVRIISWEESNDTK